MDWRVRRAGAGDTITRGVRGRLLSDETTAYTKVIVMRQDVASRVSCVATSRDCADNGCCAHVGGHFKPEEERTESKPSDSVMGSVRRNVFSTFLDFSQWLKCNSHWWLYTIFIFCSLKIIHVALHIICSETNKYSSELYLFIASFVCRT